MVKLMIGAMVAACSVGYFFGKVADEILRLRLEVDHLQGRHRKREELAAQEEEALPPAGEKTEKPEPEKKAKREL